MNYTPTQLAPDDGWVLLSNAIGRDLPPTNIVHHRDGCNLNNGRNRLYEGSPEQLEDKIHCLRCEAVLGHDVQIGRAPEGIKVEVRLQPELLESLDQRASETGQTRAATLRDLITSALS